MNRTDTSRLDTLDDLVRVGNSALARIGKAFGEGRFELCALAIRHRVCRYQVDVAVGKVRRLIQVDPTVLNACLERLHAQTLPRMREVTLRRCQQGVARIQSG